MLPHEQIPFISTDDDASCTQLCRVLLCIVKKHFPITIDEKYIIIPAPPKTFLTCSISLFCSYQEQNQVRTAVKRTDGYEPLHTSASHLPIFPP